MTPHSPHALPQFCSLVETDVGLLLLANTVAGHSGTQAARPAAQHSLHDVYEVHGFVLIIHHTNLGTATTLPVPETASQGQRLQERSWGSRLPGSGPSFHTQPSLVFLGTSRHGDRDKRAGVPPVFPGLLCSTSGTALPNRGLLDWD